MRELLESLPDLNLSGTFVYNVDAKGRIVLPVAFRPVFGGRCVLFLAGDFLVALPPRSWERLRKQHGRQEWFRTSVLATMSEVAIDRVTGRVHLAQTLRERSGLRPRHDAFIVGVGNRVEIVNGARFEALAPSVPEDLRIMALRQQLEEARRRSEVLAADNLRLRVALSAAQQLIVRMPVTMDGPWDVLARAARQIPEMAL